MAIASVGLFGCAEDSDTNREIRQEIRQDFEKPGKPDPPAETANAELPPPRVAGDEVEVSPSFLADPIKYTSLIDKYLRLNWGRDSGDEQPWAKDVTVIASRKGFASVVPLSELASGDEELLCEAVASSGYYEFVIVKKPFGGGSLTDCEP